MRVREQVALAVADALFEEMDRIHHVAVGYGDVEIAVVVHVEEPGAPADG